MKYYLMIISITFSLFDFAYFRKTDRKIPGRPKAITEEVVVLGKVINIEEVPYHVSVTEVSKFLPLCGGAIISNQHVITAAQCIDPGLNYTVIVESQTHGIGKRVLVAKTRNHPRFKRKLYAYDISVLTLERKLMFNDKVKSIALPKKSERYKGGENGLISGFGFYIDGQIFSYVLRAVEVPILKLKKCKKLVFPYVRNTLCAGIYKVKLNHCQGDVGGPLVVGRKLIGLVSYGVGCSVSAHTGVYTDVEKYIRFIMAEINS